MLIGYVLAATVIWLVPNAMGGNAVRLGALFGGPVLAAVMLARRPAGRPLVPRPGSGRRPLLAADRERHPDRPQRRRPLDPRRVLRAGRRWLRAHGGQGDADRGAADRQPLGVRLPGADFELARGWLRQLDTTRDDIFYNEGELTDASYSAWLRGNAISYVALPDAASTTPRWPSAG